MCSQPLPPPLSLPSAKLNDLGFGRIRVPKQKRNTGTKETERLLIPEASKDDDGRLLINLALELRFNVKEVMCGLRHWYGNTCQY
nr:hypothetical protein [Tanacetum cinerariifolium]